MQTALSQTVYTNVSKNVEGLNEYKVTLVSLSAIKPDKTILVNFKSEGNTGKETKVLRSTITIGKNGISKAGETAPEKSTFDIKENNRIELIGHKSTKIYPGSTYFERDLDLRGKNHLTVKGNAYFKDKVELRGTDTILIHGDAIFFTKIDNPYVNGNSALCVYGNTYYIDNNNKLVEYNPFPSGKNKSCPRPQDDEWYINPDEGVEVQY